MRNLHARHDDGGNRVVEEKPKAGQQAVQDALGGVLCRCTGYIKIIDAVLDAGACLVKQPSPAVGAAVGTGVWRLDGHQKVNFSEVFGADHWPDDALLVRAIRSPHFHAAFTFGDIEEWQSRHPFVETIVTAADIAGVNAFGDSSLCRPAGACRDNCPLPR